MEINKLDIEIGNWTEEIAIAEVGEEGHFDFKGVRIFWHKWGTNPNDWTIIGISQIGEMNLEDVDLIEKKFKDFGFLDNPSVQKQFSKIKQNVLSQYPNIQQQLSTQQIAKQQQPAVEKIQHIEKLSNIKNVVQPVSQVPTVAPIPFKTREFAPSQTNNKGYSGFVQQMKKVFKMGQQNKQPAEDYATWIINVNLNIFKRWLKTGKLINNLAGKNSNIVSSSTTAKTKATTITNKFSKIKNFLKTGKWK